jgi:hypothetical protein
VIDSPTFIENERPSSCWETVGFREAAVMSAGLLPEQEITAAKGNAAIKGRIVVPRKESTRRLVARAARNRVRLQAAPILVTLPNSRSSSAVT